MRSTLLQIVFKFHKAKFEAKQLANRCSDKGKIFREVLNAIFYRCTISFLTVGALILIEHFFQKEGVEVLGFEVNPDAERDFLLARR